MLFDTSLETATCLAAPQVARDWRVIDTEDGMVIELFMDNSFHRRWVFNEESKTLERLYKKGISNIVSKRYFAFINGSHYFNGDDGNDLYRLNDSKDQLILAEGSGLSFKSAWEVDQGTVVASESSAYLINDEHQFNYLSEGWGELIDGSSGNLYIHTVSNNKVYFRIRNDYLFTYDIDAEAVQEVAAAEYINAIGLNSGFETNSGLMQFTRDAHTGYDYYALQSSNSDITSSATGNENLLCNNFRGRHLISERNIAIDNKNLTVSPSKLVNRIQLLDGNIYSYAPTFDTYKFEHRWNFFPAVNAESGDFVFLRVPHNSIAQNNKIYDAMEYSDDGFFTGVELGYKKVESVEVLLAPTFSVANIETRGDNGVNLVAALAEHLEPNSYSIKWRVLEGLEDAGYLDPQGQELNLQDDDSLTLRADFGNATPGKYLFTAEVSTENHVSCLHKVEVIVDPSLNTLPVLTVSTTNKIFLTGETVELSATASDEDGDEVTFSWSQVGSEVSLEIPGGNAAAISFKAPEVNSSTKFKLLVTATDSFGGVSSEQVTVVVEPIECSGGSLQIYALIILLLASLRKVGRLSK